MSLSDDIRTLADRVLGRLEQDREFYVHSRQAWRLVQKLAFKGRPVGIVDLSSKQQLPSGDLESRSQTYVIALGESVFKGLSSLLEDWILGLIRIWLSVYPEDLDLNFDPATGRRLGRRQEEVQIPLSRLLHLRDCTAILDGLIERTVRDMTYERPEKWFRYLDSRVGLGCPDPAERARLYEMKAARDCLEHNRGVVSRDYLDKAGTAARFAEGELVRIDEPYLMACFALLRGVIERMAAAAAGIASGPKPPRPHHRGGRRGKPTPP
jgi:hypothetical protein